MSIIIRPAQDSDIAAMSTVLVASITQLCAADHGEDAAKLAAWTRNKTQEGVRAMLANPRSQFFVAELDDAVAAVGAFSDEGEITLNYVAPWARFRGVSKALLAALEAEIAALGLAEARLEATATALRFYRACGWQADGPQAKGRMVNGHPMRKTLAMAGRVSGIAGTAKV